MKRYIAEFKSFALKGNVTDLAVGVIIGAAFGKIIESLVGDIVMPILGIVIGGLDFTKFSFGLGTAQIMYGNFLQALFNLIIVGAALFLVVKAINRMKIEKSTQTDVAPPTDPADIALLKEIRDLLRK
jgi:large conductance mechanosensitive channel